VENKKGVARETVRTNHATGRRRRRHAPTMSKDLSLRIETPMRRIFRETLYEHPTGMFADEFAKAWSKLTHRDMATAREYLGPRSFPKKPSCGKARFPVDH